MVGDEIGGGVMRIHRRNYLQITATYRSMYNTWYRDDCGSGKMMALKCPSSIFSWIGGRTTYVFGCKQKHGLEVKLIEYTGVIKK